MNLDLTKLNSGFLSELEIKEEFTIPTEFYQKTSILELKNLKLDGKVYRNSANEFTLQATVSGIMVLEDSISLDPIDYPFSMEIEEELEDFSEKMENTLDITVPLRVSNVENFNEYQGDGWRLVDEDSIKNTNNPFKELKDMMGEE